MLNCPIHGFAPTCSYSPALLDLQEGGTLPEIVVVEVKDSPQEEAFFRFNISPNEAKELPIVNGCIPFDLDAADILDRLPVMCGFCFGERRKALEARQKQST